ncbi:MAG: hypothetical protein ACK5PP_01655 [Acidimicrobiales bacterium]
MATSASAGAPSPTRADPASTPSTAGSGLGARLRAAGPELALVAWTLFVWVGRIRNALADPDLTGSNRTWALVTAVGLTALGLITLAAVASRPITDRVVRLAALVLAGVSSTIWVVRGIQITLADHPAGFIAVHLVLAVVTVGLSALVVRHLARTPASTG